MLDVLEVKKEKSVYEISTSCKLTESFPRTTGTSDCRTESLLKQFEAHWTA